jgi:hypothetical protein
MRTPGYIVETKSGKLGRTFHAKGTVQGKVPVYLATVVGEKEIDGAILKVPFQFEKTAILCDPKTLTHKGFID